MGRIAQYLTLLRCFPVYCTLQPKRLKMFLKNCWVKLLRGTLLMIFFDELLMGCDDNHITKSQKLFAGHVLSMTTIQGIGEIQFPYPKIALLFIPATHHSKLSLLCHLSSDLGTIIGFVYWRVACTSGTMVKQVLPTLILNLKWSLSELLFITTSSKNLNCAHLVYQFDYY